MKGFTRKILAFVMCVLTVVSISGCSNGGKKDDGETPVVSMYFPGSSCEDQEMVSKAIDKYLREKYGIGIAINVIDSGTYGEKMKMKIASGEDYDICFTSSWLNPYVQNANRNAFMELDDLLKDYPKLKEAVPDYFWDSARIKGKLYAVPGYQLMFSAPALSVPTDIAKKYDFTSKTIDNIKEIEPLLKTIKKNEPDLYPFQRGASLDYSTELIGAAGVCIKRDSKDYKLYLDYELPEYKEQLKLARDWFKKGYIRSDILTMTSDRTDIANKKYGVLSTSWDPVGTTQFKATYGYDVDVVRLNVQPYVSYRVGQGTMMAINRASKHPKEALKLLEALATDKELYNMFCFGLEGVHYNKVSENRIEVVENTKYRQTSTWMFGNQFNAYYVDTQVDGVWDEVKRLGDEAQKSPLIGFTLDTEPIKTEIANATAVATEYSWMSKGAQDWEEAYEEYVEKMEQAGIRKVLKEAQRQVTEWAKETGKLK